MNLIYLLGAAAGGAWVGYLLGQKAGCEVQPQQCVYYAIVDKGMGPALNVLEPASCDGSGDLDMKGRWTGQLWTDIPVSAGWQAELYRSLGSVPQPGTDPVIDQYQYVAGSPGV
jgi:hypothetical protein